MIRLENVLKISFQDVFKTSWSCLEDVFARRLEYVLKTSWRRLEDVWSRRLCCSGSRRFEDVLKTSSEDVWVRRTYSSWSRRLEGVLKTPSEDEDERRLQDVFHTQDVFIKTDVCWVVGLNDKLPNCSYSYFSWALEFYARLGFPC